MAAIYLVRRMRRNLKAPTTPEPVDLPLWDADQREPLELTSSDADEDTAPAVLSPPEWKPPKSANGRRG